MSVIMLASPLSFTVACLIFLFRRATLRSDDEVSESLDTINERNPSGSDSSLLFEDEDDITLIDVTEDLAGSDQISKDHQFTRHVCLLVFLMVSMLIGTVLITWQINGSSMTGSYTELSFLDSFFSVGQSLFVFFIFGFDNELIIEPISKLYRQVFRKSEKLNLPPLHEIGSDDLKTCGLFVKYHFIKCKNSIQKVYRRTLHSQEKGFTGTSLVSWLVQTNVVSNRHEAVIFGEQLLRGRVIKHVNEQYHFHDQSYYYQFNTPDISTTSSPSISNRRSNNQNFMFQFEVYLKSNTRNRVIKTEAKSEDEDPSSVVRDCASDIADIFNQSSNESATSG